jgi:hypothetical protein
VVGVIRLPFITTPRQVLATRVKSRKYINDYKTTKPADSAIAIFFSETQDPMSLRLDLSNALSRKSVKNYVDVLRMKVYRYVRE